MARPALVGCAGDSCPGSVSAAGALLPDADLFDPFGAPATLHSRVGDQAAVVVLYRGAWCPCCNITLRTYQSVLLPELIRRARRRTSGDALVMVEGLTCCPHSARCWPRLKACSVLGPADEPCPLTAIFARAQYSA